MNRIFLLVIGVLVFNVSAIIAQTNVSAGLVFGKWTLAGSPYMILGSLQIPKDSTLVIDPGVKVDFRGPYKLAVQGRLLAIGTLTDSILFTTSIPPDTTPPNPTPHEDSTHWRGIVFDNTAITNDTSKIIFCKVQSVKGSSITSCQGGISFNNYSKAVISRSTISNCSGVYYGGGIYCYNGGSPTITYNIIANNPAYGIYCDYGCNSIIAYNIISNNSGTSTGPLTPGGGIYCAYSNANIFNNIITNNSGMNGGGISCNSYSIPLIYNNVICNNTASTGGGLYFKNTNTNINPSLYNNIIWGNTASNGGSQVYLGDEENDPNFFNCDIQGGSAAFALNGTIYTGTYQNNINSNPLFVAPSGGSGAGYNGVTANWSLQMNSPCIDSGYITGNYPATDMAGNPRVNVCRIDIGAYEYQNGIPLAVSLNIAQKILCNGANTGRVTSFPSGGSSPYKYLWSRGDTTSDVNGLTAGTYSVIITEKNGCSISKSITLTQPPPIAVEAGTDKSTICDASVQLEAQPKWITLNIDSGSNTQFTSVYFTSEDTGFVVGTNGALLKTTNGGAAWTVVQNITYNNSHSVYFINSKTGFVVGDYGVIVKTIDGGLNWTTSQASGSSYNLNEVFFTDANTGYAVGTSGKIIKTIDGGLNWTSQSSGTSANLNSVYFSDASNGFAVGNNGVIVKTNNGGTSWSVQTISSVAFINSVYFTGPNTGYAVGNGNSTNGTVLKTIDGGTTWTAQSTQSISMGAVLRSVYFTDPNTGYIVGGNGNSNATIMKTTNAGVSWTSLSSATTNDLLSVHFPKAQTGYAVGSNGTILKLSVNATYKWTPASGLNNTDIQNPVANVTSDKKYVVTLTTPAGCVASDSIAIHINPLTVDAGTNRTLLCGGSVKIDSITSNYTGKLKYQWSPKAGLDNDTVPSPVVRISGQKNYTLVVTTLNGCTASDSVSVGTVPMQAHDICIVSVDSSNKNILVWNKPLSSSIASFYIYRETNVTNVYQKIGTVNYNSLSIFVDTGSFPDVQSNKYKISIKDTCGLESDISTYHKTMHLSINQGTGNTWNLIWEAYEGFTVSTYNVYRGTNKNNLQFIGTSSGSNTQYTDVTAPAGYVFYQVEVLSSNTCNPSKTYNSSRSNISTNKPVGIEERTTSSDLFSVFPNPSSTSFTLCLNRNNIKESIVNIYNITGALVKTERLIQHKQEINIANLSSGIYVLEVRSDEISGKQKLLIEK